MWVLIELFGHKTVAIFDLWSLVHFLSGCGLAYPLGRLAKKFDLQVGSCILIALLVSATWEVIELYLELGLIGNAASAYWFQGVEHPVNRIFADQILFLLGYLLVRQRMVLSLAAKTLAFVWLVANIVLVPHSMYIQDTWLQAAAR
jgi:hypothetical protein